MRTIALLIALCITTPLFGEIAIVKYQGQVRSIIVVQANPIEPDPHPDLPSFTLDEPGLDAGRPDLGIGNQPGGGQMRLPLPPVSFGANPIDPDPHPERLRQWTSFLRFDPESVLNPLGDRNGDGPASLGTADIGLQNPATVAWAKQVAVGNHDPVYAQYLNDAWSEPLAISSNPADDVDPLWHQDGAGMVHAVWRRQSPSGAWQVLHASLAPGAPVFSSEEPVSLAGESARTATFAVLSTGEVLIAFETAASDGLQQVIVASRVSEGSAFHGTVIATASSAEAAPELLSRLGRTWITWIESSDFVGHRELVDGQWLAAEYEMYSGGENVGKARMTVQTRILRQVQSNASRDRKEQRQTLLRVVSQAGRETKPLDPNLRSHN